MIDERERLMAWEPGAKGFSRDDAILAVGFQCRTKQFFLADVLAWLGIPEKATGDAAGGYIVYVFSGETETAPMFTVSDGRVVEFCTVTRFKPNSIRRDGKTYFNCLDEMGSFDETVFR